MEGLIIIFFIIGALVALFSKWVFSPRQMGRWGERIVDNKLKRSLDAWQYTILCDVTLNTRRGTTQIDHIVISSFGIFVIETKNMSGWIFGSEFDAEWTQSFHRKKVRFQNPLRQNHAHVKALEELLGLNSSKFHSMVVFAGEAKLKTQMPANVMKPGGLLPYIQSKTSQVLNFVEVKNLVNCIESSRLTPGAETDALHIQSLSAKHSPVTGAIDDARGLLRQGIQTVGLVKLVAKLAVLLLFVLIAGKLFEDISEIGTRINTNNQSQSANTSSTAPPKSLPFLSATFRNAEKLRMDQEVRKHQKQIDDHLAWKASLMCGYSTDTKRCACYDPKGGKVPVEFDECKVLADKETGIIRR